MPRVCGEKWVKKQRDMSFTSSVCGVEVVDLLGAISFLVVKICWDYGRKAASR